MEDDNILSFLPLVYSVCVMYLLILLFFPCLFFTCHRGIKNIILWLEASMKKLAI